MNSFVVSVVLGMLAYFSFSAPWNWIVPIIIGVLWIVYKTGGGGGAGRDGDSWFDSDGGGFGGGDGGGGD